MDLDLKHKIKAIIDSLYHLLFNEPFYDASSSPSYTAACVQSNVPDSDELWATYSFHSSSMGDYADQIYDKVAAAVSSASYAVSSLINGEVYGEDSVLASLRAWLPSPSLSDHSLLNRVQSYFSGDSWDHRRHLLSHGFDLSTAWNDLLETHAPRFHDLLHSEWGLHSLADRFGVEPYIVVLVLMFPFVTLLLSYNAILGAGHTSGEEPPHYGDEDNGRERGKKAGPTMAGEKKSSQSSSSSSKTGSAPSYAGVVKSGKSGKSGKSRQGSKKDGAQDQG
jgi:hypothetical protein